MSTENDDNLSVLLHAAGSAWRATQPELPDLQDPPAMASTPKRRSAVAADSRMPLRPIRTSVDVVRRSPVIVRWLVPASALLVVLALVTAVITLGDRPGARGTATTAWAAELDSWQLPPATGAGVAVRGTGVLIRLAPNDTRLCATVMTTFPMQGGTTRCGTVAVSVVGAAVTARLAAVGGNRRVQVLGNYRNGVVTVTSMADVTGEQITAALPPAPCPTPLGGWRPGYGVVGMEQGSAVNALDAYVANRADVYSDIWEATVAGSDSASVLVVGTTADVASARAELQARYPGNLCVHAVRYSAAQLRAVAQTLQDASPSTVSTWVDPVTNKVTVMAVAIDGHFRAALDAAGADAITVAEPLLVPVR